MNLPFALKQYLVCVICVLLTGGYYWFLLDFPVHGIDDANIYFAFARNFSEGMGFVYNAGGERVEGFTSLAWVLVCSLFYYLSPDHFHYWLLGFNLLMTALIVQLMLRLFLRWNHLEKALLSFPVIFFLSLFAVLPGFTEFNILYLMENGLWTLVLMLIFYSLQHWAEGVKSAGWQVVFLIPLFVISRPESMAWVVVVFIIAFIISFYFKKEPFRKAIKLPSMILLSSVLSLSALIGWRLSYFGYPFPNTYYAKVSNDLLFNLKEGLQYLAWLLLRIRISIPVVLLLLPALWLAWRQWRRSFDPVLQIRQIIAIAFIGAGLAIPVVTGGDHMLWSRFYQPILPLMLLFLAYYRFWGQFVHIQFSVPLSRPAFNYLGGATVLLFIYIGLTPLPYYNAGVDEYTVKGGFDFVQEYEEKIIMLEDFFSPLAELPYLGAEPAGVTGFYYDGKVLDMYGLNDVEMAHANRKKYGTKNHASFDPDVFLSKKPDIFRCGFIYAEIDHYTLEKLSFDPLQSLFSHEAYPENYALVYIERKDYPKKLLCYASNDFINQLASWEIYKTSKFEEH